MAESHQPAPVTSSSTPPLSIAIIGAGIAGLSCALALTNPASSSISPSTARILPPHKITIFESSKFSREIGAAIHIPPNANGILKSLGVSARAIGANRCEWLANYAFSGQRIATIPVGKMSGMWQHGWRLGHRVRLHDRLREVAEGREGVSIKLGRAISRVDGETGVVYFQDDGDGQASEESFDVVLGADGVHSVCRKGVPSAKGMEPFDSGKSAFRFLVPKQALVEDERTKHFVDQEGQLVMAYGPDRRIVMYPTTDNTLVNFVCIHPSSETDHAATGDWNNVASKELILQVYRDWDEGFKAALDKADPESIKVWKLLDMVTLDTYVHGKLALLGDAAHPFLPHQGQGGAQAIEDAVSLGVLLERGLKPEEVPERLKLFEQIRKGRAEHIQEITRLAGKDLKPGEKEPVNMMKFTAYNYGHDEFHFSKQRLREWMWSKNPNASRGVPSVFGPTQNTVKKTTSLPQTRITIRVKTSRTVLEGLLPSKNLSGEHGGTWKFSSPGTVAYCTFEQTSHATDGMRLALYLHGVEWSKGSASTMVPGQDTSSQGGSDVIRGSYLPVLFDTWTDFSDGAKQSNLPVVTSQFEIKRPKENSIELRAFLDGSTWGSFELNELTAQPPGAVENGLPKEAPNGVAATAPPPPGPPIPGPPPFNAQTIMFNEQTRTCELVNLGGPSEKGDESNGVQKIWKAAQSSVEFYSGSFHSLPTLQHVLQRLDEIPIYDIVEATFVER